MFPPTTTHSCFYLRNQNEKLAPLSKKFWVEDLSPSTWPSLAERLRNLWSNEGFAGKTTMELTELLQRVHTGERDGLDAVIPLVYDELKKLAAAHLRRE